MGSMIEIQEAYVARVSLAWSKVNARTKGHRFQKSRRAARKDAMKRLTRMGWDEASAAQIVKDANDMFELERLCSDA